MSINEDLMIDRVRELCLANGVAIDNIAKECNIRQDLVLKLVIATMQMLSDDMDKKGSGN